MALLEDTHTCASLILSVPVRERVVCVYAHVQLGSPEDNPSCHSSDAIHRVVLSQGLSVEWKELST